MNISTIKKMFFVYIFALFIPVERVSAMVLLSNPAPGAGATMQDFIYLLIQIMQLVGIPMLAIFIIYAGFLIVTAGGNEDQITKGKMWVLWTLVGATIILGAKVIADFVYGTALLF